jgi:hypothetical protein
MAEQNANAVAITGGTATLTSVTTPIVQATNSAGLALKNSGGTTQISMGAGGGDNITVSVPIAINPANALVNISPTGTGTVTINPATAGTINNTSIGATTPSTVNATTITGQTETINGTGMNLVIYSQNYSFWNPTALSVTANSTIAPDSTNTASLLTANGATTQHFIFQVATAGTANSFYPRTWSCYLKAGTNNFAQLMFGADANAYANFDLNAGTVGTVGSTATASIQSVGSGWYRCAITTSSTTAAASVYVLMVTGTTASRYESNSLSTTIYAWGAQSEYGNAARTYIPTTTIVYNTPTLQFNNSSVLQIQSDGSVVLQPAGTGALQAQATTSTTAGGNARGANAVDWQTTRSAASQVASGSQTVLSGGQNNTVASSYCALVGGTGNTSNGFASFLGSGNSNSISGSFGVIAGGNANTATRDYASVLGGQSNTATGYYNVIGGGFTNTGTANAAVTTQSATMNATTAVTLSGSNANIRVGQLITGTSIANYTYVAAISGTSLTLSQAASGSSTSTLSFFTPHGVVVGGGNNQATGSYSFIGGGGDAGTAANRNVASGDWSTVAGGAKNVASGAGSVISGGGYDGTVYGNNASGAASTVAGGAGNNATSQFSTVLGGAFNIASGGFSTTLGALASTRGITGNIVFSAQFGAIGFTAGNSQAALLILGKQTTNATATALTCDGAAAGTTNQVILPNNSAYTFTGTLIANVTGGAASSSWEFRGAIERGANAASTVLVGTPRIDNIGYDSAASFWTFALTADTTNGGLQVTVTGQAGTTIRWVAKIETTEVTF